MVRTTHRLFAVAVLAAALAACSDTPAGPSQASIDPEVAAANRILGSAGEVLDIRSHVQGARRDAPRPQAPALQPSAPSASVEPIPAYCGDPSDSPYCPQIVVGAAVWDGGTADDGSRKASLYAHLDADGEVSEAWLDVYYGAAGGCTSSTGNFAEDHLYGVGSGSAFALVAQRNVSFSGGPITYSVDAYGSAFSIYGSYGEESAHAIKCLS